MSKLRNMPRAQYFTLLHFFNELQNIRKESVSSNDALSKPEAIKMTVAVQDILANDNLDSHGEKRKMPLEDGQEDPVTQPSKKMKLQNGLNEEPVLSNRTVDDSNDYNCLVCNMHFSSDGIPKAGFQIKFCIDSFSVMSFVLTAILNNELKTTFGNLSQGRWSKNA